MGATATFTAALAGADLVNAPGTAGAAVNVVEPLTGDYRESTVVDLYDCSRIVDHCDNIHFFQRTNVCREIPNPRELDINTAYASVVGTTKHVGTGMTHPDHVTEVLEMLHMIAGGEDTPLAALKAVRKHSTAIIVATQLWYPQQGGAYVLWYLPLLLAVMFRPKLTSQTPPIIVPAPSEELQLTGPGRKSIGLSWFGRRGS